jgi:hypothetical protein
VYLDGKSRRLGVALCEYADSEACVLFELLNHLQQQLQKQMRQSGEQQIKILYCNDAFTSGNLCTYRRQSLLLAAGQERLQVDHIDLNSKQQQCIFVSVLCFDVAALPMLYATQKHCILLVAHKLIALLIVVGVAVSVSNVP